MIKALIQQVLSYARDRMDPEAPQLEMPRSWLGLDVQARREAQFMCQRRAKQLEESVKVQKANMTPDAITQAKFQIRLLRSTADLIAYSIGEQKIPKEEIQRHEPPEDPEILDVEFSSDDDGGDPWTY